MDLNQEWNTEAEQGLNNIEFELFRELRKLGLDPVPNYKIKDKRVSFCFTEESLAIDIIAPEQSGNKLTFALFKREGYNVEFFNAEKVFNNTKKTAKEINKLVYNLKQEPKIKTSKPFPKETPWTNWIKPLLVIMVIVLAITIIYNQLNKPEEIRYYKGDFDISAVNIEIPMQRANGEQVDLFCKDICSELKVLERSSYEAVSVMRCYCEGKSIRFFDTRTEEELNYTEVKKRTDYHIENYKEN